MHQEELLTTEAVKGVTAITATFLTQTLEHMIPWLMVTLAAIICDLISGLRRSLAFEEEVRLSRAFRDTMGKIVTYFSFVLMVCMMNSAVHNEYQIDVYACLFVCTIEMGSVLSNILEPKGININLLNLVRLLARKFGKVKKEDVEGLIEKRPTCEDVRKRHREEKSKEEKNRRR